MEYFKYFEKYGYLNTFSNTLQNVLMHQTMRDAVILTLAYLCHAL